MKTSPADDFVTKSQLLPVEGSGFSGSGRSSPEERRESQGVERGGRGSKGIGREVSKRGEEGGVPKVRFQKGGEVGFQKGRGKGWVSKRERRGSSRGGGFQKLAGFLEGVVGFHGRVGSKFGEGSGGREEVWGVGGEDGFPKGERGRGFPGRGGGVGVQGEGGPKKGRGSHEGEGGGGVRGTKEGEGKGSKKRRRGGVPKKGGGGEGFPRGPWGVRAKDVPNQRGFQAKGRGVQNKRGVPRQREGSKPKEEERVPSQREREGSEPNGWRGGSSQRVVPSQGGIQGKGERGPKMGTNSGRFFTRKMLGTRRKVGWA